MNKIYQSLVRLLHKIGMDRAIAYGSGARIIQAIAGVVTLFFIAAFLSGEEQGYYYTFSSLLGIQVFFELGFTNILTQFVAHEAAHLKVVNNTEYEGDEKYRSRLSSLLHFSVKWYTIAAVLMLVTLLVAGYYLFHNAKDSTNISWFYPYLILCIATAIKLLQSPFTAILMGLNKVAEMNEILFIQQLISPIVMWILLICHASLYVIGVSSVVAVLVWFIYVFRKDTKDILINIYKISIKDRVKYMSEIFPYQWRMAVSSFSGFFIFYFITPILFKYQGSIIAGQMGMTITVVSAIQSLAMTWQNTKVPLYSQLIAKKDYVQLDKTFSIATKQMIYICSILMFFAFLFLTGCDYFKIGINGNLLSARFLLGWPLMFMMIAYTVTSLTFAWATYLRCHKKEPYMWMSLVSGIACLLGIWITSKYSSILIITLTYMIVRILVIPWSYNIFLSNKTKWHADV